MTGPVVIIGGGLMGCWTAFFLRRRGIPVTVIEKGAVGAQAAGVNFGNVRLQGRYPGQYPLSIRAQALWERIESLIGERCEFEQEGHLYIATGPEQDEKLRHTIEEAHAAGVASEPLDAASVQRRFPYLADTITSGAFSARCATANPRLVAPAVARAARRLGAAILEQTRVTGIDPVGGGFRVTTDQDQVFPCTHLVNTAGAWAPAILAMFGESVPLFAAGPPQFVTEPLPRFILPSIQAIDGSVIVRQVARGNVVFAGYPRGPSDPILNRAVVQLEKTVNGLRNLVRAVPCLEAAHIIRVWSGIEGYLPDMLPVIAPSGTHPRLLHAFGFCGHGFQLGPGVGDTLAEIIAEGGTPIPLGDFALSRFTHLSATSEKLAAEFDPTIMQGATLPPGASPAGTAAPP